VLMERVLCKLLQMARAHVDQSGLIPKVRAWLFQSIAVIAIVAIGLFLFDSTQTNLQKCGLYPGLQLP